MKKMLRPFLPANATEKVLKHFDGSFLLKIVSPRTSKLGDFRAPMHKNIPAIITINNDLNPYSFLLTLLHEIAHHKVWLTYPKKVQPHGKEWKATFKEIMLPFLHPSIFPETLLKSISAYLINPKASSCTDVNLYRALSQYDTNISDRLQLESLPADALFTVNNKYIFKKGKKLRTRYKCLEINTKKQYLVHGLAAVKIVNK